MSHENVLIFRKNGKQELLNAFPSEKSTPLWTYAVIGNEWYWMTVIKGRRTWQTVTTNFVPKEYKMMALILPRV